MVAVAAGGHLLPRRPSPSPPVDSRIPLCDDVRASQACQRVVAADAEGAAGGEPEPALSRHVGEHDRRLWLQRRRCAERGGRYTC